LSVLAYKKLRINLYLTRILIHYTYVSYNEELHDTYSSPNIVWAMKSRIMRLVGHVARVGERRVVYRVLVENPEEKRPLGRPTH
jgi:hypothetical protein